MPTIDTDDILTEQIFQRIVDIAERTKSRDWFDLCDACQDIWLAFYVSPTFILPQTVSGFIQLAWRHRYEMIRRDKFRKEPLTKHHEENAYTYHHLLADEARTARAERLVNELASLLTDKQLETCLAVVATQSLEEAAQVLGVTPRAVQVCLSRIRADF